MNAQKKIEKCLKDAPKPTVPDGLLQKLQSDLSIGEVKTHHRVIREWFAPAGGPISLWRVAAAAGIAIAVLLPLSYGAAQAIKYFTLFKATFEYPEDNTIYSATSTLAAKGDTKIQTIEDAQRASEEFYELYKQGKAKEVQPGVWVVTLSNREEFAYGGDPNQLGVTEAERKELLKRQFDEINELRKAGKYERVFIEETEENGRKIRLYRDRFTLSNGKVVSLTTGEEK